jgi:methyltransferase (TIGR00027 family)
VTDERLVRNISDTARWVAAYRAQETARPDAVFRDPFARMLAGERGEQIAASQAFSGEHVWAFTARTFLFDQCIVDEVRAGAGLVVNLAAGLDARPYRMDLPRTLRWVEVDLPEILDYKTEALAKATPVCALERIPLDLSNVEQRRDLFVRLGGIGPRALVITEGLLIYLDRSAVDSLARDLAAVPALGRWAVDICSPRLLEILRKRGGETLAAAGAPYRFAPPEGPAFFEGCGWRPIDVRSTLQAAAALKRLPLFLRMIAMLPESRKLHRSRPWSAVVRLEQRSKG